MKYVDSSAVLRVLFRESGPTVPLSDGDFVVSSELLEVEVLRALERVRLLGQISDEIAEERRTELFAFLDRLDLVPIDRLVIARAGAPFPVQVRSLDALHVATAELLISESDGALLEFWTHDQRQALAAQSRGLTVRGV